MSAERGMRRTMVDDGRGGGGGDDADYYIGSPDGSKPKYPIQQRQNRKGGGVVIETTTLGDGCSNLIDECAGEKTSATITYSVSMCGLILTAAAFFGWPALLPYIYIVALPIFIVIRIVYYFTQKWQHLLLDLSLFLQLNMFAFLWAGTDSIKYAQVSFGLAFGTLIFTPDFFTRSWCLVPHSGDRMINMFFAFYPALIMYNVRHEGVAISDWWYEEFLADSNEPSLAANFGWVFGIPFGIIIVHFILYTLLVYLVLKPEREVSPTSFYQIMANEGAYLTRFIEFFSDRPAHQYAVYTFLYMVGAAIGLLLAVIWWESRAACAVALCIQTLGPIWYGGEFYIKTLGPKDFDPKSY